MVLPVHVRSNPPIGSLVLSCQRIPDLARLRNEGVRESSFFPQAPSHLAVQRAELFTPELGRRILSSHRDVYQVFSCAMSEHLRCSQRCSSNACLR